MPTCDLVDVFCDGALSGNPLGVVHGGDENGRGLVVVPPVVVDQLFHLLPSVSLVAAGLAVVHFQTFSFVLLEDVLFNQK